MKNTTQIITTLIVLLVVFTSKSQDFGYLWQKSLSSTFNISMKATTTDENGNIYICGDFRGEVDFDPSDNVSIDYTDMAQLYGALYVLKLNSKGELLWQKKITSNADKNMSAITVDNEGNVYTTGYFTKTVDFDPGEGVFNLTSANQKSSIFISKLNSNGEFVWAKKIGETGVIQPKSIALDKLNNIYVGGIFTGTTDFDPGTNEFLLSASNSLGFILKLDKDGEFVNAINVGGTSTYALVTDLTVDDDLNIYITGYNSSQIFVSKYDSEGAETWSKLFVGRNNSNYSHSIALDNEYNIYISGTFTNTVDFDPSSVFVRRTSNGAGDAFLCKLNNNGEYKWVQTFGSSSTDKILNSHITSNGVLVTGYTGGAVNFNLANGSVVTLNAATFFNQYDFDGELVNVQGIEGVGHESSTINNKNELIITGYFNGNIDFNPGENENYSTETGQRYILKLLPQSIEWSNHKVTCNETETTFSQTVKTSESIPSNAIALDFELEYDLDILDPTNYELAAAATAYGELFVSKNGNGKIFFSIFLNQAPLGVSILPLEDLVVIDWTVQGDVLPNVEYPIKVSSLRISYPIGSDELPIPDNAIFSKDELFHISLKTPKDESIIYDNSLPSSYLKTEVKGYDVTKNSILFNTSPNLLGEIITNTYNAEYIVIQRDVLGDVSVPSNNCAVVSSTINTADMFKVLNIINGSIIPTPAELLAADVNLDGVVTAGDVSLISSRSINQYNCEFPQIQNYSSNGLPNNNYTPSKDWVFISDNDLSSMDFNKYSVPSIPEYLLKPNTCTSSPEIYRGILLGDVNQNWITNTGASTRGLRISSNDYEILIDFVNIDSNETSFIVPVKLNTIDFVYGVDLIFDLDLLPYEILNIQIVEDVSTTWNNTVEKILLQTFEYEGLKSGEALFYLVIDKSSLDVKNADVPEAIESYVNGENSAMRIITSFDQAISYSSNIEIYPNPAKNTVFIKGDVEQWQLRDIAGRVLLQGESSIVNIDQFGSGVFFLIVNGKTKKLIIE